MPFLSNLRVVRRQGLRGPGAGGGLVLEDTATAHSFLLLENDDFLVLE